MSYPGDASLDAKIQQRILSAFAEAVRLHQEGSGEECRTVLRSILEVDPSFAPATRLMQAVDDGTEVDLGQLLGDVGAAGALDIEAALIEARQAFAERDYARTDQLARQVLEEMPGHEEARQLVEESARRVRGAAQVEEFVAQARTALRDGSIREVETFLELARDLDPAHPEIAAIEAELSGGPAGIGERPMEFEFQPAADTETAQAPPAASVPGAPPTDLDETVAVRRQAPAPPAPAPPGPPPPATPSDAAVGGPEVTSPPATGPAEVAPSPAVAPVAGAPGPQPAPVGVQAPQPPGAAPDEGLDGSTVTRRPAVEGVVTPPPAEEGAAATTSGAPPEPAEAPPEAVSEAPPGAVSEAPPEAAPEAPEAGPESEFEFGAAAPDAPAPAPEGFSVDQPQGPGEVAFEGAAAAPFATADDSADAEERIQALLDQGQQAFDGGDYQGAIDTWSRVYLIQSTNAEADRRIEEAQRRREEVERKAEHAYFEAREAFEQGRLDQARELCQQVLELIPQHLEAHDLLARLETPTAPPPPPTAPPEEEDLFRDDFVPARTPSGTALEDAAGEAAPSQPAAALRRVAAGGLRGKGAGKRFPVPVAILVGAVALLVIVVGFLLRSTLFGGAAEMAADTLAQAEEAAEAGRLQEAINLLRALQASDQIDGDLANRVGQRILDYQRRLRARPTPTPPVQTGPIREAIDGGRRVHALILVRQGLARVPGDPELVELQRELLTYSASLAPVADAVAEGDMDRIRRSVRALLAQHADDAEGEHLWRAATFNLAIEMLRKYEVGTAKSLLDELERKGDQGEDLQRVAAFAERYLSKPVDPRYQIFVANLELRPLQ